MSISDTQHAHSLYQMVSNKAVGHSIAVGTMAGFIGVLTPPLTFALLLFGVIWYALQISNDPRTAQFVAWVRKQSASVVKWVKARFNKPKA